METAHLLRHELRGIAQVSRCAQLRGDALMLPSLVRWPHTFTGFDMLCGSSRSQALAVGSVSR